MCAHNSHPSPRRCHTPAPWFPQSATAVVFLVVVACLLLAPIAHVSWTALPPPHTARFNYYLHETSSAYHPFFRRAVFTYSGPCALERDLVAFLTLEAELPPDLEVGDVVLLECKVSAVSEEGHEIVENGLDGCVEMDEALGPAITDAEQGGRCLFLHMQKVTFMSARVRVRFSETFEGKASASAWSPLLDERYRPLLGMDLDSMVTPFARQGCDDRSEALLANTCMRGTKGAFVASSLLFSRPWVPREIVLQFQVRMTRMLRSRLEGGPGSLRLIQALGPDEDACGEPESPAALDLTVDWNRISEADEHPTGGRGGGGVPWRGPVVGPRVLRGVGGRGLVWRPSWRAGRCRCGGSQQRETCDARCARPVAIEVPSTVAPYRPAPVSCNHCRVLSTARVCVGGHVCLHVTVWVNFRRPGVVAPFATFTFVTRILEDCNSHMVTLYVRSSGLGSLYIDFQVRIGV